MRFLGSALRFPHEQNGFRDLIVVGAAQCVRLENPEVTLAEAACADLFLKAIVLAVMIIF
jgi:L-idonate 5-dehydrogenase